MDNFESTNVSSAKDEKLIGICTECGFAITAEENIGQKLPKLKCQNCTIKSRRNAWQAEKDRYFSHKQKVEQTKIVFLLSMTVILAITLWFLISMM